MWLSCLILTMTLKMREQTDETNDVLGYLFCVRVCTHSQDGVWAGKGPRISTSSSVDWQQLHSQHHCQQERHDQRHNSKSDSLDRRPWDQDRKGTQERPKRQKEQIMMIERQWIISVSNFCFCFVIFFLVNCSLKYKCNKSLR